MQDSMKDLSDDAKQLKQDVVDAAKAVKEEATQYVTKAAAGAHDSMNEMKDHVKEHLHQKGKELDAMAHEKPWMIAAIGAGIGMLVGLLVTRRSRD